MFDALERLAATAGHPVRAAQPARPSLEALEDRAVPALISGLMINDAIYSGMPAAVVAPAPSASVVAQPVAGLAQSIQEVNFGLARTDASRSGALKRFDPALGQLTRVTLQAEGNLTSAVQLENLEAAAVNMQAQLQGQIRYQVAGATLQSTVSRTLEANLGAFDGGIDLAGSSAKDFGLTRMEGSFNAVTLTAPADLASFVGTGTIPVTQDARVNSGAVGSGNLMALVRSTTQGKVKVVYTYQPRATPAPQPIVDPVVSQPSKFFLISGLQW